MWLKAGASLRAALTALGVATGGTPTWVDFTPTATQNNSAFNVTVSRARYAIIGKSALVQIRLVSTASSAGAGIIRISSIPSVIAPALTDVTGAASPGTMLVKDVDTGNMYAGVANFESATELYMWLGGVSTTPFGGAFTIASGDFINANLSYELA